MCKLQEQVPPDNHCQIGASMLFLCSYTFAGQLLLVDVELLVVLEVLEVLMELEEVLANMSCTRQNPSDFLTVKTANYPTTPQ